MSFPEGEFSDNISANNEPKHPVNTYRAVRQLERFLRYIPEVDNLDVSPDRPVAVIHYYPDIEEVVVRFKKDEELKST